MQPNNDKKIRFSLITDLPSLAAIEMQWQDLFNSIKSKTIYQSFDWIYNFQKYLSTDRLMIIVVYVDDTVKCIAPFSIEQKSSLFWYKRLRIIGSNATGTDSVNKVNQFLGIDHCLGWSDSNGFLVYPGMNHLMTEVAKYIDSNRHLWDVIDLRELPGTDIIEKYFFRPLAAGGAKILTKNADASLIVELNGNYSDYFSSRTKNYKKTSRNAINRMKKSGGISFNAVTDPEKINTVFPKIKQLEMNSWKGTNKIGAFSSPSTSKFHTALMNSLSNSDRAIIFTTHSSIGSLVSYYFGFSFENILYLHSTAYDPSMRNFSPGSYLLLKIVEWAFNSGYKKIIFGRGTQPLKRTLSTGSDPRFWVFIYRKNIIMNLLYNIENRLIPWVRVKLKSHKK